MVHFGLAFSKEKPKRYTNKLDFNFITNNMGTYWLYFF